MEAITALLIDDEAHNRSVLKTLLQKHCPDINIIGEASGADSGFMAITHKRPRLVFLDIKMPNKSGFDLLKMFDAIDFEVIFVSAFNEYAITAFEFNALGYILKPIDYMKLIGVVEKAVTKINTNKVNQNVFYFVKTLEEKNDLVNKIAIHHNEKVVLLTVGDLISVEVQENLCELKVQGSKSYYSSKDLKLFEDMLEKIGDFIRINKSVIINSNHIKSYSKGEICVIEMINGTSFEVSRRKKTEVLRKVKFL
jgi:two-component system LytT family response regulator